MTPSVDPRKCKERHARMAALAARLVANDESACGEILREMARPATVTVLGKYYWLTLEDCDDILAIAVRRLWEKRSLYDPSIKSLDKWLLMIVMRAAAKMVRRTKDMRGVQFVPISERDGDDDGDPLDDFHPNGEMKNEHLIDAEVCSPPLEPADECEEPERDPLHRDIDRIIGELGQVDHRILFTWSGANGDRSWTPTLAAELGITQSSLRVRLFRIRKRICSELRKKGHHMT
jgi:DNA-directed RNA polymerase specialized sigma24 family protein